MPGCWDERSQGWKERILSNREEKKMMREILYNGILPTVGVFPALREVLEDNEEELSALARGAVGGGLALAVLAGLNGRTCVKEINLTALQTQTVLLTLINVALYTRGYTLTISLIPVSFPVGSFGLDEGRGGGTRAPVVSGVVGLFGAVITQKHTFCSSEEVEHGDASRRHRLHVHVFATMPHVQVSNSKKCN